MDGTVLKYIICLICGKTYEEHADYMGVSMSSCTFSKFKGAKDRYDVALHGIEKRQEESQERVRLDREASIRWLKEYHENRIK